MAKLKAKGCTLKIGSTELAQVVSLSGPSITAETVDCTELGDASRSFLASVNDYGEVSAVINYDPDASTHQTLTGMFALQVTSGNALNLTPQSWVITFSDSTPSTFTFSGVLTGFNVESMEVGGLVTATVTIKLSGAITIA